MALPSVAASSSSTKSATSIEGEYLFAKCLLYIMCITVIYVFYCLFVPDISMIYQT